MADNTKIEWTDATWNPVTGCSVVSPGCTNCYAMRLAGTRLKHVESRKGLTIDTKAGPVWNGEVRFNEKDLDQPLRWRRPRLIFVCAHGDLFHENVPDEWIDRVFAVMALAPQHTFQVLTKRSERMRAYVAAVAGDPKRFTSWAATGAGVIRESGLLEKLREAPPRWPLPNVWVGVSAEDQHRYDERVSHLRETPAAIRYVSAEPLLGPIDADLTGIDWVIVGGESGSGARPMHPDWARSLRDQCAAAGVAFHFKQWGEWGAGSVNLSTGQATFRSFPNFQTWVNKASTWVNGGICLDAKGRHCRIGGDMMRAQDEGAFPVSIMHRVGKKAAGRLLDGVEHNDMPEVRHG